MKFAEAKARKERRDTKGCNRVRFPAHVERSLLAGKGFYGDTPKPRKRLKQMSTTKAWFHSRYVAALKFLISLDPLCRRCRERPATEGHHPLRQRGWLIFFFWPFCRACHNEVEDDKKTARTEGWILYQ